MKGTASPKTLPPACLRYFMRGFVVLFAVFGVCTAYFAWHCSRSTIPALRQSAFSLAASSALLFGVAGTFGRLLILGGRKTEALGAGSTGLKGTTEPSPKP